MNYLKSSPKGTIVALYPISHEIRYKLQYVFNFVKGLGTRNLVDKIECFTKSNIFNIIAYVEPKIFHFIDRILYKIEVLLNYNS